jgi:3-oxoadipate enol-lactonase
MSHGSFVDVGTTRVYVETWGETEAPPLLCLHGLGGGTHFFGALGASLALAGVGQQRRTIAIDQPGSGLSPLAGAFSFDAVTDLVVELVELAEPLKIARGGGARPLYLLGHSMGAILALEVIRRAPDLVSGLIIVGGLREPLPGARARIRDRVETIRGRPDGLVGVGSDVVGANFSRRSQAERPELTALFAKLFDRQDPAAYASTAEALAAWNARELPPLDRMPCLVITGEEDRYAPPEAIQSFARMLPARTRVEIMPDCGHLPFLEQPAAFAALVSSFLAALE